jgi:hypothetical protein
VWTGIEYAAASMMIDVGLVDEGIAVVAGARSRHDGERRNPWNEPECGHHYVRAMSSWSLLTALSGFSCSVPEGRMTFAPRVSAKRFRSVWSNGAAWGVFRQRVAPRSMRAEIEVLGGALHLRELVLACPGRPRAVTLSLGESKIGGAVTWRAGSARVVAKRTLNIGCGETLAIRLSLVP